VTVGDAGLLAKPRRVLVRGGTREGVERSIHRRCERAALVCVELLGRECSDVYPYGTLASASPPDGQSPAARVISAGVGIPPSIRRIRHRDVSLAPLTCASVEPIEPSCAGTLLGQLEGARRRHPITYSDV